MAKKTILILILVLITFIGFSIFSFIPINSDNPDLQINDIKLKTEASIGYGGYAYFYAEADEEDRIDWEFSGSNNYVGITVYAMTDAEFSKFQYLLTFYAYTLSNGSYIRDSGTFKPRSHDTWYVVFLNSDSDMQTTYLTYDVDFIRGKLWYEILLGPIIVITVIGSVLGVVIVLVKKAKTEKEAEKSKILAQDRISIESTNVKTQQIHSDIKYCTKCGSLQKIEAIYCEKCGNKF